MSVTFDSIISNMMKKRKDSISNIENEKNKQILPYGYRPELRDTFNEIVKEDPDYVRRYLKASSNIAYQTDVYIDSYETKQKLMYKNVFNNDSVYLNFGNGDKVLVVCVDSSLASDNYDFYADVFVNGRKLRKENFLELPSTKHYNFKTGARRYLIDEDKVNIGDIISVVIRKEPKCKSFYTTVTINSPSKRTYFVDKALVGRYGENIDTNDNDITNLDNLLVFKKSALELDDNYFQLDTKAYVKEYIAYADNVKGTIGNSSVIADITILPTAVKKGDAYEVKTAGTYGKHSCLIGDILFAISTTEESTDDNWGRIPFDIQKKSFILDLTDDVVNKDDVYLIINRAKHIEREVINETQLEIDEYLEYGYAGKSISMPLVDKTVKINNCYLPLPVKSIDDVEIFIDGYRAINGVDYIFINDEKCDQYIRFIGVLKRNSVVTYRNKCIDTTYNFYENVTLEPVESYVMMNDKFVEFATDEVITPNVDVAFLSNFMAIPYDKEKHGIYREQNSLSFVDMLIGNDETINILDTDEAVSGYESVMVNGINYILYDESFGENEAFVHVEFIKLDVFVSSLIIDRKIVVRGLASFNGSIYTKYNDSYEPYRDDMIFLDPDIANGDSEYSYGIIDFCDKIIPICESYIEAYVGRRRVSISKKRSIINRFFKIDDQHTTFSNIEIYSEINWTDYAKTIIDMLNNPNEIVQNIYSQLHAIDGNSTITETWLDLVDDIKYNDETEKEDIQDIFFGRFDYISFDLGESGQQIRQYTYPILKVKGFFNNSDIGIDITNYCEFTFKDNHGNILPDFDTEKAGDQYITATFNRGADAAILTDEVVIKVIELELRSIKILTNTNFFTTDDNILENIRVIGTYENGSQKVVTNECEIILTSPAGAEYEDGYVDVEGAYIVNAVYLDKTDARTILVDTPESRIIKSLDIISNSFMDPDDEAIIDTKLDIYATFSSGLIQKIDNESVVLHMYERNKVEDAESEFLDTLVVDANGKEIMYSPELIQGLELNTNYKFRAYVYTDNKKTDLITADDSSYTDIIIKLLHNPVKAIHQVVYYDNLTATLDTNFVGKYNSNNDYYYFAIKNLDGVYLTLGQGILDSAEGVMTVSSLNINDTVIVEFYNKATQELTKQVLFMVMDVTTKLATDGIFEGNIADGYKITISKLALNEEYDNIDFTGSKLRDIDGNTIVAYDVNLVSENNNYIENKTNDIYIYFRNFKTKDGNVMAINNYITNANTLTLDLFFEIPSLNKTIELHVPEYYDAKDSEEQEDDINEFETFNWKEMPVEEIILDETTHEDEKWLVIKHEMPIDREIDKIIEIRPNTSYVTDITANGINVSFQLRKNSISGSEFEPVLDILRCGINRYCFIMKDGSIYYTDVNIKKHVSYNVSIIDTINGVPVDID